MAKANPDQVLGTLEAVKQFPDGWDFEPSKWAVSDIWQELATKVPAGCHYSVETQTARMIFRQLLGCWLPKGGRDAW